MADKRSGLKQYITDGFLTSIDNMRPELESSPFMDAQSFDGRLSVEKVAKNDRRATVRIELNGRLSGQHRLNVYLIKSRWQLEN